MKSAECLDRSRLGKQRIEARLLIDILSYNKESRWANHPACKMWKGYEECLKLYYNCCLVEWSTRGYENVVCKMETIFGISYPKWWGDQNFHSSHRLALLCKNFEHYKQFNWLEEKKAIEIISNEPEPKKRTAGVYFWPTQHDEYQ